jgi:hypothetical protein
MTNNSSNIYLDNYTSQDDTCLQKIEYSKYTKQTLEVDKPAIWVFLQKM